MLLPLLGDYQPPKPLLIEIIVIEEKVEPPKQIIDPNHCEPLMYWAAEAPYYCIEKPHSKQTSFSRENTPQTIKNSPKATNGWYDWGNCTAWVASKRPVGQWNDATEWLWQAQRDGWATGSVPTVGAIAWEYGHVSYVEAVNETTVDISEMNYQGLGVVTYRTRPINDFTYIY